MGARRSGSGVGVGLVLVWLGVRPRRAARGAAADARRRTRDCWAGPASARSTVGGFVRRSARSAALVRVRRDPGRVADRARGAGVRR